MADRRSFRFRRCVAALCALGTVGVIAHQAAPASAAPDQLTVFDHVGSQTSSHYFEPTLNQPDDYTSPVDFARGEAFVRLEVTSKLSDAPMIPMLCFWRHTETTKFAFETCAFTNQHEFTEEGVYWIDAGTPAQFWKKNGVFDWSEPVSLGRIMMKDPVSGKLWLTRRCGGACYPGNDIDEHIPVQFSAEVVFVAAGARLDPPADWEGACPADWGDGCAEGDGSAPGGDAGEAPVFDGPVVTAHAESTNSPGVSATRAASSISTWWTSVGGATEYQVRWENEQGDRKWSQWLTGRSLVIDGLDADQEYTVSVRARKNGQWRPYTDVVVPVRTDDPVPPPTTAPAPVPPTTDPAPAPTPPPTTAPAPPPTTAPAPPPTTVAPDPEPADPDAIWEAEPTANRAPTVRVEQFGDVLDVRWSSVYEANAYQVRTEDQSGVRDWSRATTDRRTSLEGIDPIDGYRVAVRARVGTNWRAWTEVTLHSDATSPATTAPATTVPTTTAPATTVPATTGEFVAEGNGRTIPTVRASLVDGRVEVTWDALPDAPLYQLKYRGDTDRKDTWQQPSPERSAVIDPTGELRISVRALVDGTWRTWNHLVVNDTDL